MRRRALLSASLPKNSGGGGDIEVVIPEGMFPLYFEHDYYEDDGFGWITYYKDVTPEILNTYYTLRDIIVAYGVHFEDVDEYMLSLDRCQELGVVIYVDGCAMVSSINYYVPDGEIYWDVDGGYAGWTEYSLWWEFM